MPFWTKEKEFCAQLQNFFLNSSHLSNSPNEITQTGCAGLTFSQPSLLVLVSWANWIGWFTGEDLQTPPQSQPKALGFDREELEWFEPQTWKTRPFARVLGQSLSSHLPKERWEATDLATLRSSARRISLLQHPGACVHFSGLHAETKAGKICNLGTCRILTGKVQTWELEQVQKTSGQKSWRNSSRRRPTRSPRQWSCFCWVRELSPHLLAHSAFGLPGSWAQPYLDATKSLWEFNVSHALGLGTYIAIY